MACQRAGTCLKPGGTATHRWKHDLAVPQAGMADLWPKPGNKWVAEAAITVYMPDNPSSERLTNGTNKRP